ncbi:hypothetical protein WJ01_28185 [Burkholderia vietnamiensis]|nr:hypothetical protein WJ01_28185 [Burkholderia vietnamiensis]
MKLLEIVHHHTIIRTSVKSAVIANLRIDCRACVSPCVAAQIAAVLIQQLVIDYTLKASSKCRRVLSNALSEGRNIVLQWCIHHNTTISRDGLIFLSDTVPNVLNHIRTSLHVTRESSANGRERIVPNHKIKLRNCILTSGVNHVSNKRETGCFLFEVGRNRPKHLTQ